MRNLLFLLLLLLPALVLAACSGPSASNQNPPAAAVLNVSATPTSDLALNPTVVPNKTVGGDMRRVDEQGMVVVEVTPLNLETPADKLEFDVAMNTHSVNLSMDLAKLSTLSTDTGVTVQAALWDAPAGGGHHVSGKLVFPSTNEGKPILEGASKLTLTILNVDAPSRTFEWELK